MERWLAARKDEGRNAGAKTATDWYSTTRLCGTRTQDESLSKGVDVPAHDRSASPQQRLSSRSEDHPAASEIIDKNTSRNTGPTRGRRQQHEPQQR